jgi:hypothetical protein
VAEAPADVRTIHVPVDHGSDMREGLVLAPRWRESSKNRASTGADARLQKCGGLSLGGEIEAAAPKQSGSGLALRVAP